MGQEIAVTPIQMVTAMSVVANGGWLMTPHVVSSVVDGRGQSILTKNLEPKRRPISAQTAKRLSRILETVVESGTGQQAKLVGYRAAGKTGTSQKVDPKQVGIRHQMSLPRLWDLCRLNNHASRCWL